jgi:hypothetical protein
MCYSFCMNAHFAHWTITVQYSLSLKKMVENLGNVPRGMGFQNGTTLDFQEMLAYANWLCARSNFNDIYS